MRRLALCRAALLAAAAWLLNACTGVPMRPEAEAAPLGPPLETFVATGRASLRQGERSDHLKFVWQHDAKGDQVSLQTPLGQGVAELWRDATGARMQVAGQPPVVARDLGALAENLFGRSVPLDALPDWLRGSRPQREADLDGWKVSVVDDVVVAGRRLPRVMHIRRHDVELRLVIDEWGSE